MVHLRLWLRGYEVLNEMNENTLLNYIKQNRTGGIRGWRNGLRRRTGSVWRHVL